MSGLRDPASRHAVLRGHLAAIPPASAARCVRVFISANPEDTEAERQALREHVFPKLREFCRDNYGLDFQAVDVFWGMEPGEWHEHEVRELRTRLLLECMRTSVGPCFVGLLGERYGDACLPGQIEAAEFERILESALGAGLSTRALEEWYRRDENAVPPAYYLLPRGARGDAQGDGQSRAEEREAWMSLAAEMRAVLKAAVTLCQSRGLITSGQAQKYFTSGVEEEFMCALDKQPLSQVRRCVCYIRSIQDAERFACVPRMARYLDLSSPDAAGMAKVARDPRALQKLQRLRDSFVPACVSDSKLRVYSSVTLCDARLGYTEQFERQYVEGLCRQFYEDMIDIMETTVPRACDAETERAYEEVLQHVSLCTTYRALYAYACDALAVLGQYVAGRRSRVFPLVVFGGPCSGKTLLMAEAAARAYQWLKERKGPEYFPTVLVRFLGSTDDSSTLRGLLRSLCQQVAWVYGKPLGPFPEGVRELQALWLSLLTASSNDQPLVIILDALDQLAEDDDARSAWWLPPTLPSSVRVIVSTLPNKFGVLQSLKKKIPDEHNYVEMVARDKKTCNQMLKARLLQAKRKVTSGQQIYINEALLRCTLPMYLNLLLVEVSRWRSHKDVDDSTLCRTVHESIENLFANLELKCGPRFVSRALGYVTLAKHGLCEAELEDVLSLDDYVVQETLAAAHQSAAASVACGDGAVVAAATFARVPYFKVATLRLELQGYLVERDVHATHLLVWANRHLVFVANKLYLSDADTVTEMHGVLADYFSGQWSAGRPKPLQGPRETLAPRRGNAAGGAAASSSSSSAVAVGGRHPNHDKKNHHHHGAGEFYDRQAVSQPWNFQCRLLEISQLFVNLRKLKELPYHLTKSGRVDDLLFNVILDFGYMHAMVQSGRLHALVLEMEAAHALTQDKDVRFLADTLRGVSPALMEDPNSLSTELQQRMLPFVRVYPKIRHILQVCDREGLRYCSIVTLLSPMDRLGEPKRVPLTTNAVRITDVLPTSKPGVIVAALDNGTVSTWDLARGQPVKHITTHGVPLLSAQLNGDEKYLVASTLNNTLLVFDHCSSTLLYEVEVKAPKLAAQNHHQHHHQQHHHQHHQQQQQPAAPPEPVQQAMGGFRLSTNHALAWLERSTEVHVIDLNYGWPLCVCHCWYEVTCAQCSEDGMYAFCGQQLNTTSIFRLESGERLATVTSECSAGYVHAILLAAQAQELYAVDNGGSLAVWDLEEITNPQLVEEFDCRGGEAGDVASVELCKEQNALLICKRFSMEVWDTFSWAMTDKFKARRNEKFLCAVLSRNCESIVAAIEMMASIFIWRRDTGQCLATLPGNSGIVTKLIKSAVNDTLLAVTSKGVLSVWDMEAIDAISAVDKTGKAIRCVLLPSRGECVFTTDGTDTIYRWNIHSGFIESLYKHEGVVEQCVLTSSAEVMVSADASGNQFVWITGSGECLFRITGQRASQLLVTHNDLFVVSLCEKKASRVWRLATGNKVCNILVGLENAAITAANTFLVGLNQNALLAVNLWTGSVSKKFACEDGTRILAYRLLPDCPDYVAIVTTAGTIFTWSLADEAVRRRVQLPAQFHKRLEDFQISPSGKLAVLSTGDESVNVLDLHNGKLRVLNAGGAVWQQKLSTDGRYIVYVCYKRRRDELCALLVEDPANAQAVTACLKVVRLADGKCIGACTLYKAPSCFVISKRHLNIVIGFEDGSVGAYTVVDNVDAAMKIKIASSPSRRISAMSSQVVRPRRLVHAHKAAVDVLWRESSEEFTKGGACGGGGGGLGGAGGAHLLGPTNDDVVKRPSICPRRRNSSAKATEAAAHRDCYSVEKHVEQQQQQHASPQQEQLLQWQQQALGEQLQLFHRHHLQLQDKQRQQN
uniref:NACHT and WD repeat domain-containing protein 2 n=1 Tax=Petromyzon marinus TaxID=7757 RepID=A0AAJ7WUY8_PETMA|nr:NACHT and WD repeat domain-containing protein 2 [Petromyzon marinus]